MVDGGTAIARDQLIEADGMDVLGPHPSMRIRDLGRPGGLAAAAETHDVARVAARRLPYVPELQPAARDLALRAVGPDHLGEYSVVVADPVADRRVAQRRHRIQEARGEAAQAAVAEARIGLLGLDIFEVVSHLLERRVRF